MVAADSVELGSGTFRYEALATWEQLPDGMTLRECAGVAVDAEDLVYLITRNTAKSHRRPRAGRGASCAASVRACSRTARTRSASGRTASSTAPTTARTRSRSGRARASCCSPSASRASPRSASAAIRSTARRTPSSPRTTARSSSATVTATPASTATRAEGELELSWGSPGIDAGQFMVPHNLAIDEEDRIYVADRESHRVAGLRPRRRAAGDVEQTSTVPAASRWAATACSTSASSTASL